MSAADQSPPAPRTPPRALLVDRELVARHLCHLAEGDPNVGRFRPRWHKWLEEADALIADCTEPAPQRDVNRGAAVLAADEAWDRTSEGDEDGGEGDMAAVVDAILALVQPVEGVLLSPEEAQLVARCARSFRGDRPRDVADLPSLEPGTVYERLRLLAEKCEAAS